MGLVTADLVLVLLFFVAELTAVFEFVFAFVVVFVKVFVVVLVFALVFVSPVIVRFLLTLFGSDCAVAGT